MTMEEFPRLLSKNKVEVEATEGNKEKEDKERTKNVLTEESDFLSNWNKDEPDVGSELRERIKNLGQTIGTEIGINHKSIDQQATSFELIHQGTIRSVQFLSSSTAPALLVRSTIQNKNGIPEVSLNVRKLVVKVCDVVTRRAARLAAAGIVGILKKIGRDGSGGVASGKTKGGMPNQMRRTVVAVEGGLYTNYTMFREYLNEAMGQILGEDVAPHVVIKVTEDGSGIGAALLAASNPASSAVDTVQLSQ